MYKSIKTNPESYFQLYKNKKDCCGCGACLNICSEKAISMKIDEYGFIFPEINYENCNNCGLCKKVCAFQKDRLSNGEPLSTYAAVNKDKDILLNSSSGGVFASLSHFVFEKNGIVFGSAYNKELQPEHISVDNPIDMKKLQGSKYVQSYINHTYQEAQKYLKEGKWVLFTGTPCQIAGLNSFLDRKYERLITADLICHGVPNAEFFGDYINYLEEKYKGEIISFNFRNKSKGWFLMGKVIFKRKKNWLSKYVLPGMSYYYSYFLKKHIYRDSCYNCKYACGKRPGDFTLGDYWGIEKFHPEINTKNGVSVLLVNSMKAQSLLSKVQENIHLIKSSFKKAKVHNRQLRKPPEKSGQREDIFNTWRRNGVNALSREYYRLNKKRYYVSIIKNMVPYKLKRLLPYRIKKLIKKKLNI